MEDEVAKLVRKGGFKTFYGSIDSIKLLTGRISTTGNDA